MIGVGVGVSIAAAVALSLSAVPLDAQDTAACPHGPATAVPVGVTQKFRGPFNNIAPAVSATLRELWYRIDSSAVETMPADSGGGKRGFWRTRRSTRWPDGLDRSAWRGRRHPGLVVTVTLTQRGDSVVAEWGARVPCAVGIPELDAPMGPVHELQKWAGLEVSAPLGRAVRARGGQ
jgi:hypothetical protein